MLHVSELQDGQSVFVIYSNPHTPTVATIQEGYISVDSLGTSVVVYDYYHTLEEDDAVFASYEDAEQVYNQYMM
ncbi:transcriptional regulator SplA domain-containing protein [Shouchella sp. 1P09AA]|uniref:transcriptional regulator SplA domain-containing protein n=1 Tax=Bacillaceae TaxID=186817 RepID=UPI000C0733C8|nr:MULTISPECIES: transcriptional regulator SplA domain-containing protein [Bacillaceae]UTR05507.1 transcriptional regulator [Alkalihalobacillus sp. LMS6]